MGLNSEKTSNFLVLIFAVFLPDFIFCTTVAQAHPSIIYTVHAFDLYTHKTRTFTMWLAATTTTKETVLR